MKKEDKRCYYGHSMRIYNTAQETKELKFLQSKYSKVLCPNSDIGETTKGMKIYLNIIRWADIVAISEYNGFIGKGVFEEIETALENKIPVKLISPFGTTYKLFDVREIELWNDGVDWVVYGKIIIKKVE